VTAMLQEAGFGQVSIHPAWDGLALKDAPEWVVYVAERTIDDGQWSMVNRLSPDPPTP
jgi:hypothetical protein